MQIQFYQLARGARFEYKGKTWIKTAMAIASQEDSGEAGFVVKHMNPAGLRNAAPYILMQQVW